MINKIDYIGDKVVCNVLPCSYSVDCSRTWRKVLTIPANISGDYIAVSDLYDIVDNNTDLVSDVYLTDFCDYISEGYVTVYFDGVVIWTS